MKFLAIILSLLILLLSAKSCSDGQNFEDLQQDKVSIEHNHQKDSNDSCPVVCVCSCCGMSITYQPLATFKITNYIKVSKQYISTYQSIYRFNFHTNIWQPPKLIS